VVDLEAIESLNVIVYVPTVPVSFKLLVLKVAIPPTIATVAFGVPLMVAPALENTLIESVLEVTKLLL
jgi:hypothetical protein